MKKATVRKPFTTDKNHICLNGDVIYLDGVKVFFKRIYLGEYDIEDGQFDKYFKIEQVWE